MVDNSIEHKSRASIHACIQARQLENVDYLIHLFPIMNETELRSTQTSRMINDLRACATIYRTAKVERGVVRIKGDGEDAAYGSGSARECFRGCRGNFPRTVFCNGHQANSTAIRLGKHAERPSNVATPRCCMQSSTLSQFVHHCRYRHTSEGLRMPFTTPWQSLAFGRGQYHLNTPISKKSHVLNRGEGDSLT